MCPSGHVGATAICEGCVNPRRAHRRAVVDAAPTSLLALAAPGLLRLTQQVPHPSLERSEILDVLKEPHLLRRIPPCSEQLGVILLCERNFQVYPHSFRSDGLPLTHESCLPGIPGRRTSCTLYQQAVTGFYAAYGVASPLPPPLANDQACRRIAVSPLGFPSGPGEEPSATFEAFGWISPFRGLLYIPVSFPLGGARTTPGRKERHRRRRFGDAVVFLPVPRCKGVTRIVRCDRSPSCTSAAKSKSPWYRLPARTRSTQLWAWSRSQGPRQFQPPRPGNGVRIICRCKTCRQQFRNDR